MSPSVDSLVRGTTGDFTVRVITSGVEVTGVSLSIKFNPQSLEVVDADPSTPDVQIQPHPQNPLNQFTFDNVADNTNGTIIFTVAKAPPGPTADFNLALVTFRAKVETGSNPAQVVFVVDEKGNETSASRAGKLLLKDIADFPGTCVAVTPGP